MQHIALYFGSFNPIHIGHLLIARYVLNEQLAQKVWFVVSPQNPLKQSNTLLNEHQRLHLVSMAIEKEPDMKASNIEFSLPRPSYTIDTLTYLKEKYPQYKFSIIMGGDSYSNLPRWKNYEKIIEEYTLLVYPRKDMITAAYDKGNTIFMQAPMLEISSTEIRKLIKNKKSIRFMVPENVAEEIDACGYYKA